MNLCTGTIVVAFWHGRTMAQEVAVPAVHQSDDEALPSVSDDVDPIAPRHKRLILPSLDDFPIPERCQIGDGWTDQMREMADHIGAHHTLLLCAHFGGMQLYVPARRDTPAIDVLGPALDEVFRSAYAGNRVLVPVGGAALRRARRASLLSAVRHGMISGSDAAAICGTSRTYMSHLINGTNEGRDIPPAPLPERREVVLLKRAAVLARDAVVQIGASPAAAANLFAAIVAMATDPNGATSAAPVHHGDDDEA